MLVEQGLGKYCDSEFIKYTSREMQEALNMTSEEMDMAAHQLIQQNRGMQTNLATSTSSPNSNARLPNLVYTNESRMQSPQQQNTNKNNKKQM